MPSSLGAQLSQLAAKSSHQLDLKAQKASHFQSLIFETKVAGSQSFDSIYQICHEGFQELCVLDQRFTSFGHSIFSSQSRTEDRTQMTAAQNEELNKVIESFLGLVGGRLLLKPAIKTVEWLIRRFRVHEYNTNFLLLTFLPYHTADVFLNLLSIIPANIEGTFRFLHPYIKSLKLVPRQSIVFHATNNTAFFTTLNNYVLRVCKEQQHYHGLLAFWAGITTEAVAGMLESARSGRREVQRQKEEDVLLRVLPVLDEVLRLKKVSELRLGSFMIIIVLANNAELEDRAIDALMESVARTWSLGTIKASLVCLASLAQRKQVNRLPRKALTATLRVGELEHIISELGGKYNMGPLVLGLINGILHRVERGKGLSDLAIVERLFHGGTLDASHTKLAVQSLLATAQNLPRNETEFLDLRSEFSITLQRLNESVLNSTIQTVIHSPKFDVSSLEVGLQSVLAIGPGEEIGEADIDTTGDTETESPDAFVAAVAHVPECAIEETSFLSSLNSPVFKSLERAFLAATMSPKDLNTFAKLPIFRQTEEFEDNLFFSFFLRMLGSSYRGNTCASAVHIIAKAVSEKQTFRPFLQILFPYALFTLASPSESVRQAACKLILALKSHFNLPGQEGSEGDKSEAEILRNFYGASSELTSETHWLSRPDMNKLLDIIFIPNLEEFVLDSTRISLTVERALRGFSNSNSGHPKAQMVDLKKALRHELFFCLKYHMIMTPLYEVKLRLLDMLNSVEKVGSTSCGKELLPLLKEWAALTESGVNEISIREGVQVPELESHMVTVISPNDRESLSYWLSTMKDSSSTIRSSFRKALFGRIQNIFPSMKVERQLMAAGFLLEGALRFDSDGSNICREILYSVSLHSDILTHLITKVQDSIAQLPDKPPPAKRRRTSQTETKKGKREHVSVIRSMTFILELVDSSKPENHPAMFGKLFDALATVQQFKTQVHSELAYVQNLALGSLLAIVKASKGTPAVRLDTSIVRADLIVDCIRHTQSPQVQNTALLLIANLASIAPDVVLHSVMPIFTFLGASVLRHNDEYSTFVIDQTIEEVIPPLIQSLRNQKRDVVTGTSELLHSFAAAFEHIPSHRRLRLFRSLVSKLGPEDFLYAVIATLGEKYESSTQVRAFAASLSSKFDPQQQLISFTKLIGLVDDALQVQPAQANILLGVGQEGARGLSSIVTDLLRMLGHLLRDKPLISKVNDMLHTEAKETAQIRSLLSRLVEQVLDLSESSKELKEIQSACKDVLGSLLGVLSIAELIDTVQQLLKRDDDDFRRRILKLVEARIRTTSAKDTSISSAAMNFLPTLTPIIESAAMPTLRHAAIACVDQICEKYGKIDSQKVVEAMKVICSERCLSQPDERTQIISSLCITSIIEVLGEAVVPVLPETLSGALDLLYVSIEDERPRLHNATYSIFSSLLAHIPWMISGSHLDKLLQCSLASASAEMGDECDTTRRDVLQLMAKNVDIKQCIAAIEGSWSDAVSKGTKAVQEALSVLSTAIEKSPKSAIVDNAQRLSELFFKAFDLRRTQLSGVTEDSYEEDEVAAVENSVNRVAIKMIYKLNDSTFRPLFVELVEWATVKLPKKDGVGRILRLTTMYTFLEAFFEALKSIVTSYASHIADSAVAALNGVNPKDPTSRALWQRVIQTLTRCFEHDQDEFWQSPSHFTPISSALIAQFTHASSAPFFPLIIAHLLPSVVALAACTSDVPSHHKALLTPIMKHLRSEHPTTRLAAVKLQLSLTERLGEEWLSLLPEMLPGIAELLEDDDEGVEREARRWVGVIEGILGESLGGMLQ